MPPWYFTVGKDMRGTFFSSAPATNLAAPLTTNIFFLGRPEKALATKTVLTFMYFDAYSEKDEQNGA